VDEQALSQLIEWQVFNGVTGIVPVGTTGESPTLSTAEHKRVIDIAVEAAAKRVTVIAGTGSNSTTEAIDLTRYAAQAGADAVMVVTPYYNKPTQQGMIEHFAAVQAAAEIPNIIYNIPGRSVVNLSDETIATLAKLPNIAGIKDATGDLARVSTLRQLVGPEFSILSSALTRKVGTDVSR